MAPGDGDPRRLVRDFLTTRRARLTPEQVGLSPLTGERRVAGLRRGEVAQLAGVSVQYYTRIERGHLAGASDTVLDAIARALRLDAAERVHLRRLARVAGDRARQEDEASLPDLPPSLQLVLDAMPFVPALVRDGAMNVLATNGASRALYAPALATAGGSLNLARFCFLDPAATDFYGDWPAFADANVELLRAEAGRHPASPRLAAVVAELHAQSEEFRRRWAAHDVRSHRRGSTRFVHPVVGELELFFDSFDLADRPDLTLKVYTAPPGSTSYARLRHLSG